MRIKLLHFNDLHGHIVSFTSRFSMTATPRQMEAATQPELSLQAVWCANANNRLRPRLQSDYAPIFSRVAAWLHAVRTRYADDPRVAVLAASAGDESGGDIFDLLLGRDPESYQLHAGYRLCSQAGVDLGVIGNHDLDRGDRLLAHAIGQDARFPVLSANVTGSPALAACCYPAAIFVTRGVRIGFIGLTTPAQVRPEPGSPRRVADPVATALHLIPALRPLCDVLVILSHLGYSLAAHSATVRGAGDVELARSLPAGAVHLIVGGHTHNALNENGLSAANVINGIPIVQAGKLGQFAGEVDIGVQQTAAVTHARLRAAIDLPVDETFEREHIRPAAAAVQPYSEQLLGQTADDDDLSADAVANAFAAGESALANFITDALVRQARERGLPVDLAMIDASGVSDGLPVGAALSLGDWFALMPYADTLCLYRLTGRQLGALLQDNAYRLDRPGQPHVEAGFLHFSGQVRYAIEAGAAPGQARAVDVRVDNQPIEELLDRTFLVAASSFLRELAASWEAHARRDASLSLFDLQSLPAQQTAVYVRDLLVEYIIAHGGVLPEGGARRDGRLRVLN